VKHALISYSQLCSFLCIIFCALATYGQELLQLNSYYGTSDHIAKTNCFAESGALYLGGQFSGEVFIGLNNAMSFNRNGVYISKQYSDGTMPFLQNWTGSAFLSISSLTVQGDSVLVVGTFSDSLFVDNDTLINDGLKSGYMVVLDTLGSILSSWNLSSYSSEIYDVCFTKQGYIALCGEFYNTMTIDQQLYSAPLGFNSFVVKMDPSTLESVWVRTSNGTATNARKIGSDKFDNLYATGSYGNGTSIEGQQLSEVQGEHNAFTVSYNANGELNWVKTMRSSVQSHGISQSVTENGDVYVGGEYEMDLEVAPSISYGNSGLMDAFFVKYNLNGSILWSGVAGGIENDILTDITLDETDNPVFLFNGGDLTIDSMANLTEGFRSPTLAKIDKSSGELVWSYRLPVAPSSGIAEGYSLDCSNDLITLCGSNRTGLFYFGEILDSPNLDDSFWAIIRDTLQGSGISSINELQEGFTRIYPNPAVSAFTIESSNDTPIVSVEIFDSKATLLKLLNYNEKRVEFDEPLEKGMYHLRITTNQGTYYNKLLKL
jgi:hypothetical protein